MAHSEVDVNADGVINILDLILVAQHMGEPTAAAAPSMLAMKGIEELDPATIQAWIERAQLEDDGSVVFQESIAYLQRLLASLIPEQTALLANYPNPFNPETWIPYTRKTQTSRHRQGHNRHDNSTEKRHRRGVRQFR